MSLSGSHYLAAQAAHKKHATRLSTADICYARSEMKLPHGERAIVDRYKLEEYCLNPRHPRGRNKARVFASVGIGPADAEVLQEALLAAEAVRGGPSAYGERYMIDFDLVRLARNRESSEHMDRASRRRLAEADDLF